MRDQDDSFMPTITKTDEKPWIILKLRYKETKWFLSVVNYRLWFVFDLCCGKGAGGQSPNQNRKDLHTSDPQRHPLCLPDIRAVPKQELQSLQYFIGKVSIAMIKKHMYYLEGSDLNESLSGL